jgi:uncharacterized protein (DUF2252 family)
MHLSNFGIFASPERRLVFDINNFDECYSGPGEYDLKRLVASVVVAGRKNGFKDDKLQKRVWFTSQSNVFSGTIFLNRCSSRKTIRNKRSSSISRMQPDISWANFFSSSFCALIIINLGS